MDALLSVDEVAKRLGGLSRWTIYSWLSAGKLKRVKIGGRVMVRESEVQRVIREGESEAPKTRHAW